MAALSSGYSSCQQRARKMAWRSNIERLVKEKGVSALGPDQAKPRAEHVARNGKCAEIIDAYRLLLPSVRLHAFSPPSQAMEVLDVQMAVHVYRQLGDAGMVMGLERIAYVEDKNLLAGHVALLFGNYQTAQVKQQTKPRG